MCTHMCIHHVKLVFYCHWKQYKIVLSLSSWEAYCDEHPGVRHGRPVTHFKGSHSERRKIMETKITLYWGKGWETKKRKNAERKITFTDLATDFLNTYVYMSGILAGPVDSSVAKGKISQSSLLVEISAGKGWKQPLEMIASVVPERMLPHGK